MTINFYVFSKSQTLKMLTVEFCCHHNQRMKNRIYRIFRINTNNNYFVLFQPEFQWVVCPGYAVYNTFILFMLHQYTESISGNGTFIWNSLSNIISKGWDGSHMIYFYLMQPSDTWHLILCVGRLVDRWLSQYLTAIIAWLEPDHQNIWQKILKVDFL